VKRKVSWRQPRPELGCRDKGKKNSGSKEREEKITLLEASQLILFMKYN
jgi:hypothetical protein